MGAHAAGRGWRCRWTTADPARFVHLAGYWAWGFALAKGFIKKQRKSKLARKRESVVVLPGSRS